MMCISVFEKYKDYGKNIILLAIETMPAEDRMILKKGYGPEYLGKGYLFKNEEYSFEWVDKKLETRIKDVNELLKNGKTRSEILAFYTRKTSNSYVSMYSDKSKSVISTQLNKIPETFLDFFTIQIRKIITKMLPELSEEDREIIGYFYWGKSFDIPKKYEPDKEKMQQLNLIVSKMKIEALKKLKTCSTSKPIIKTTLGQKNNQTLSKVTRVSEKNDAMQVEKNSNITIIELKGFLEYFDEKDHENVLQIVERFKETNINYYEVINKRYSGERYETVNDVVLGKESITLSNAKVRIKQLLSNPDQLEIFLGLNEKTVKIEHLSKQSLNKEKSQINKSQSLLAKKEHTNIQIQSVQDILNFVPIREINDVMMNTIMKNRTSIFRIMSMDDIINCYIGHLNSFEEKDAIMIVKIIATYQPDKISQVIESSYFKNKLQYLTLKEQEYIYLTLLSYSNHFLTSKRIAEILEVDRKTLEEYQVMTSCENINQLNILFKEI